MMPRETKGRQAVLPKYEKQSNIAVGVVIAAGVGLFALHQLGARETSGGASALVVNALYGTVIAAIWAAFWAYAKAKGYSGTVGILLPFLNLLGLIILLALRDKCPNGVATGPAATDLQVGGTSNLSDMLKAEMRKVESLKQPSGSLSLAEKPESQRKPLEAGHTINAAEGVRRMGVTIRWIADGLGVLSILIGVANIKDDTGWLPLGLGVVIGAAFSGIGRAINWVVQGFAKKD
jgi:hypothetical protein